MWTTGQILPPTTGQQRQHDQHRTQAHQPPVPPLQPRYPVFECPVHGYMVQGFAGGVNPCCFGRDRASCETVSATVVG